MSLPNDFVFVQFQSLAYLIKVSNNDVTCPSQLTSNSARHRNGDLSADRESCDVDRHQYD
jgi:hypothetical protein